jgi:Nuclease-related domain/TadE-like protein
MTTRVFDLQQPGQILNAAGRNQVKDTKARRLDLALPVCAAVLLVPVAGAFEAPGGWFAAGFAALLLLSVAGIAGARVPWGWAAGLAAGAGYFLPRGPWPAIGPALFVATVLCVVLWLARENAASTHSNRRQRGARQRERQREAQVMMGLSGERHVGQVLAAELPQEFALINGLALRRGAGDIDHLVVGPTGVFLLETKTMAGHIVCDAGGTWHRTRVGRGGTPYDAYIGDPATQVQRNIFAVRQALRRRLPELFREPLWIEGLVVFAHPETELDAEHSRVPAILLDQTSSRICGHVPRRRLQPREVEGIVGSLLAEMRQGQAEPARHTAQAMVEMALLLPLVLVMIFTTLSISRIVQAETSVISVAHEAARAGALAQNSSEAVMRMRQRAAVVADGLGLNPDQLRVRWDLTHFADDPGEVQATASYRVDLSDLPVVGGVITPTVTAEHVEWVDPFRSAGRPPRDPGR